MSKEEEFKNKKSKEVKTQVENSENQGKDKNKKDTHKMAESNKAFAHFGRRRSKPKK